MKATDGQDPQSSRVRHFLPSLTGEIAVPLPLPTAPNPPSRVVSLLCSSEKIHRNPRLPKQSWERKLAAHRGLELPRSSHAAKRHSQ